MRYLRLAGAMACGLIFLSMPAYGAKIDDDWAKARTEDTAEALAAFIENHPKSKYAKLAETTLRRHRLDFAVQSNDIRALEIYLKLYPTGDDTEKVKNLLLEAKLRQAAQVSSAASESTTVGKGAIEQRRAAVNSDASLSVLAILGLMLNSAVLLIFLSIGFNIYRNSSTKSEPGSAKCALWGALILTATCAMLWLVKLGLLWNYDGEPFPGLALIGIPLGLVLFFVGASSKTPAENAKAEANSREMAQVYASLKEHERRENERKLEPAREQRREREKLLRGLSGLRTYPSRPSPTPQPQVMASGDDHGTGEQGRWLVHSG